MTTFQDSKYTVHEGIYLPPAVFGETYIVSVGSRLNNGFFRGEVHVLIMQAEPKLYTHKWRMSPTPHLNEHLKLDIDWVLHESNKFGTTYINDYLGKKAVELKSQRLLESWAMFRALPTDPFLGFRLRGVFEDELRRIEEATESEPLRAMLEAVNETPSGQFR